MEQANQATTTQTAAHSMANYFAGVYAWMFAGLSLSGVVAYAVSQSPTLLNIFFGNPFILIALIVVEFGLVIFLSSKANKLSKPVAGAVFLLYAGLLGITLSGIFLAYTQTSIMRVFFITASMFLIMSIAGYITKADLTKLGSLLFMGLIGIIVATVVNIFLHSNVVQLVVSYLGVAIFLGLTAFDVQKIKQLHESGTGEGGMTIFGALSLYLDFLNLFLFLLRIFGRND